MSTRDELDPARVKVTNEEPIEVKVQDTEPVSVRVAAAVDAQANKTEAAADVEAHRVQAEADVETRKARATAREKSEILRTEDSRKISGMWEGTQRQVALIVVITAQVVVGTLVLAPVLISVMGREVPEFIVTASVAGMLFLTGVANLVIGFYFGRTNHTKVGGRTTIEDQQSGR